MKKTRLKGGSLSEVWLIEPETGTPFVRKQVSLINNREYGFNRWYSQLKRQERYTKMFSGVFPVVQNYGALSNEVAYFDMEYVANSTTVHDYLVSTNDVREIDEIVEILFRMFDIMHSNDWKSTHNPIDLYVMEEIITRINDCRGHPKFDKFANADYIVFNGVETRPITKQLDKLREYFSEYYKSTNQMLTHGNSTLENMLYVPATKRIVFIDPYEENIIDSKLCDFSQVYQSSNSKYELYNSLQPTIDGLSVTASISDAPGLELFNLKFKKELVRRLNSVDLKMVDLFEISQFVRMLPFKMQAGHDDRMIFFFALASNLFRLFEESL